MPDPENAASAEPSDPPPARPMDAVAAALRDGRDGDAVRLFLRALAVHGVPGDGALLSALREQIGREETERLIGAFAALDCFYCRRGFDPCVQCRGSGQGEDPRLACLSCMGLGATPCDFCGGSGLATYNFMPPGLRAAVAVARTQAAERRLASALARTPEHEADPRKLRAARKALAKQLVELGRDLAIMKNAAQVSRRIREADAKLRTFTARLFARSSRSAEAAQLRIGRIYRLLSEASERVAGSTRDADTQAFERERAGLFEKEARRFESAAKRRSALFTKQ